MKYEIRQLSWSKRRNHSEEKEALKVSLIGFEKKPNHFCKMIVNYDDEEVELNARVIYNEIQDYWVVSGINTKGNQCSIKIIEEK